jgi:hypothetical protein
MLADSSSMARQGDTAEMAHPAGEGGRDQPQTRLAGPSAINAPSLSDRHGVMAGGSPASSPAVILTPVR